MSGPGSRPFNAFSVKSVAALSGPETYLRLRGAKIMIALLNKTVADVDIDVNVMGTFHSEDGILDFPFAFPFSGIPFCAVAGNHNITATDSTKGILKCLVTEDHAIMGQEILFQAICIGPT